MAPRKKQTQKSNPFFTKYKWWEKPSVQYSFYHPSVRLRLERLMGTQVTNLTDRQFMLRYQERLLDDYADKMEKRCKVREFGELERLKTLVLKEILPVSAAPTEMANHPIMLIDNYCNKLITARRALIKVPKVTVPTFLYWDDTPDIETGLKIGTGHVFRPHGETLCLNPETYQHYTEEDAETYALPDEEFNRLVYEDPLVKQLLSCNTVEQMYKLANKIVGSLMVVDEAMQKFYEDTGSETVEMEPTF